MNIEEIFAALSARMVEGMMYHSQMSMYFAFLGMDGYRQLHDERFADETAGYRRLNNYYIDHYCRLVPEQHVPDPKALPESWMPHVRADVDSSTKRKAVQQGASGWVQWEIESKALYEQAARDLMALGEMAAYKFIMDYVKDVDAELARARSELLYLEATNYDMSYIMDRQETLEKEFGRISSYYI